MHSLLIGPAACSRVLDSRCLCKLAWIAYGLSEQRIGVKEERRGIWVSIAHTVDKRAKPGIESCNVSGFCSLI